MQKQTYSKHTQVQKSEYLDGDPGQWPLGENALCLDGVIVPMACSARIVGLLHMEGG